jgi:hypothetical protein
MVAERQALSGSEPDAAPDRWPRILLLVVVLLGAGLRIFLTSGLVTAPTRLDVDDTLFHRLSGHIANGEWLGPYDVTTLVKGCGYSLFLAACQLAGLARRLGEDLLLIGACVLLVLGLRSIGVGRFLAGTAYILVLLHPAYSTGLLVRTLLVLGARRLSVRLACAFGLGSVLGWFLITREEGLWIAPALVLLGLALLVQERRRRGGLARALPVCLVAAALAAAPALGAGLLVRHLNQRYYGVAVEVEFKEPAFVESLIACNRVAAAQWHRWQPLDPDARRALYRLSPAFGELAEYLESDSFATGDALAGNGGRKAGFHQWALRAAASSRGYHASATQARAFYRRLAQEIHAACDEGRIPAGPRRASLLPELHPDLYGELLDSFGRNLKACAGSDYLAVYLGPLPPVHQFTRAQLTAHRQILSEPVDPGVAPLDPARYAALRAVDAAWHRLTYAGLVLGAGGLLVLLWRFRSGGLPWLLLVSALAALVVMRSFVVATVTTYWFPSTTGYLVCVFALIPLASIVAVAGALQCLAAIRPAQHTWSRSSPARRRAVRAAWALAAGFLAWTAVGAAQAFQHPYLGVPLSNVGRLLNPSTHIHLRAGTVLPEDGPGLTFATDPTSLPTFSLLPHKQSAGELALGVTFRGAAAGIPWRLRILGNSPRTVERTTTGSGPELVRIEGPFRGVTGLMIEPPRETCTAMRIDRLELVRY